MKLGRNDPCHCGSGRKYKKCCLAADQAAAHEAAPARRSDVWARPAFDQAALAEPHQPDPLEDARDAFWQRFEAAGYQEQFTLVLAGLREPGLIDGDLLSDLLVALEEGGGAAGPDHQRLIELCAAVPVTCPELYTSEEALILERWLNAVLALGQLEAAGRLIARFAANPDYDRELLGRLCDRLAFDGHLELLEQLLLQAALHARHGGVHLGGAGYFTVAKARTALLTAVEAGAGADERAAALQRWLPAESEAGRRHELEQLGARLAGERADCWTATGMEASFAGADAEARFAALGAEFAGWLWRRQRMPLARALMAGDELASYLSLRHQGALDQAARVVPQRRPPVRPAGTRAAPGHPLCPEAQTLNRYLDLKFTGMALQLHPIAALAQALPGWLGFLAERGLISAEERHRTEPTLLPVLTVVSERLRPMRADPGLQAVLVGLLPAASPVIA